MRLLVLAGMLGSILWLCVLFISFPHRLGSLGKADLLLSILWHPLVAAGWLGIHHYQSNKWDSLSFFGALFIALSFLVYIPIPLGLLTHGYAEFPLPKDPDQLKRLLGILVFPGYLLLAIAVLKHRYYPPATAYFLILAYLAGLFLSVQYPFTSMAALGEASIPIMLLYLGWFGLNKNRKSVQLGRTD